MKAQDLRIGNWVDMLGIKQIDSIIRATNGSFKVVVCERKKSGISVCENVLIESVDLKPIPLTPDELVKLGFKEMSTRKGFYIRTIGGGEMTAHSVDAIFDTKTKYFFDDFGAMVMPIGRIIIYVHEFQNFHKEYTGEELTYTK